MTESMKAVRIHKHGGPEVLTYEDAPRPRVVCAANTYWRNHTGRNLPGSRNWSMPGT